MKKQPERTAATKQSMIDSFWALAKSRGIRNVTISSVTKEAGLNRGTFYVYFEDMPDLLRQAEGAIANGLREQMQAVLSNGVPTDFRTVSEKAVQILSQYDQKLFLLLGKEGDPGFIAMFRNEMADMFQSIFSENRSFPELYREHIIVYLTSGFVGLFTYWYENGKSLTTEELVRITHRFAASTLLHLNEGGNPHNKVVS